MTNKTTYLLILLSLIFSFSLSPLQAEQLVATVDGKNVTLDWSAMPDAQSNTLYVALGDITGDIDINTLASVNMAKAESLYAPNLPSGLIIYAAIVAHASQGAVVSNIVKLMPFGGALTFPESGDVVVNMNDADGIGTLSITGTRNANGSIASISQISGDDGSGAFVLTLTNDQFDSYTKGSLTIQFIYHLDGSIGLHTVNNDSSIENKSISPFLRYMEYPNDFDLCEYKSKEDFKSALLNPFNLGNRIDNEVDYRADKRHFPRLLMELLNFLASRVKEDYPSSHIKLLAYHKILLLAYDGIKDEVMQEELDYYDNQCNDSLENIYGGCSIPDNAKYRKFENNDGSVQEYYLLDGHYAGPYMLWYGASNPKQYACYDEYGERHGERRIWYENKNTRQYEYNHGVMLEDILWFASGNLAQKIVYQNGKEVEYINYYDAPDKYKQYARYENKLLTDWYKNWYEDGAKKDFSFWTEGKKNGEAYKYREDGTLSSLGLYKDGLLQTVTYYEDDGKTVAKVYNY